MNLKSIISVVSVLGIFDKLRFNKNRKQKNIKEKSIEQKNTILKKDNTNSPSYTNINYEYKPSTRKTPRRTRTQQPKNFSLESTMEWKHCPYCDKRINKKAKKCPYCNYDFERGTLGAEIVCNSITTKTVNKNGLSFECPDYYDIGIYKSEDEIYKSIVALSKNDRECEIYVMEYRPTTFHWKLRKKPNLLKKELKLQGYDNVTYNKDFEYCFDAIAFTEMGAIKTTILFNFDTYKEFIIICNRHYNSDYDCIYDMKIINDSISSS